MPVKEKEKRVARHANSRKTHPAPARERARHQTDEDESEEPHARHRLAPPEPTHAEPRSKRHHNGAAEEVPPRQIAPAESAENAADEGDEIEPSPEELQAEEATVQAVAGSVPRDEDA